MRSPIDKNAAPSEKLDFIFSHICNFESPTSGLRNDQGGVIIDFGVAYMQFDYNFFGLSSYDEMVFYLNTLKEKGFVNLYQNSHSWVSGAVGNRLSYFSKGQVTFEGLDYLSQMNKRGILSKRCFVAMVFDANKIERLRAIQAACLPYNFDAFIIESYSSKENQTIDAKIIAAIKSSRFCIIDFTSLNQGAYFEAGIAVGREMKAIFVCEKKDFQENRKHFDVNHYPFICYESFAQLTDLLNSEIGAYIA